MSLQTSLSLAYVVLTLGIAIVVVGVAIGRRPLDRRHLKIGLILSATVAVLLAPSQILGVVALDVFAVLDDPNLPPGFVAQVAAKARWLAAAGGIVMALASFAWRILLVPVAELADPERPAFPHWAAGRPREGLGVAVAVGILIGIVSTLSFSALGVTSALQQHQQAWFPGVDFGSVEVVLGIALPALLASAISEELMFRGVLQRWLVRRAARLGEAAVPVAIVLTSLVWALGHVSNADAMGLKMSQIFGLGLVLGALSRRFGVEASLAAHLSFNLAVALGSLALT